MLTDREGSEDLNKQVIVVDKVHLWCVMCSSERKLYRVPWYLAKAGIDRERVSITRNQRQLDQ